MRTIIAMLMLALFGCCAQNEAAKEKSDFVPRFTPGPPALVYKTKADYTDLVPVILSDDKTTIVSYPDPLDIKSGQNAPRPSVLHGGYLLDNRGIGPNVAFLRMTYEEYAKLPQAPTLKELQSSILDKEPLTELCDCGNKTALSDPVRQLNILIDGNTLRSVCRVLK